MVQSPIGKKQLDSSGSLVGAARMDPAESYSPVPNVEETDDPNLIFTASFNGEEVWRELRLSEYDLK